SSDVPAGPPRNRLSAAGGVDLSRSQRRGQYSRGARSGGARSPPARRRPHRAARGVRDHAASQNAVDRALRRRASPGRDRPGAGKPSQLHAARGPVPRHRSQGGGRNQTVGPASDQSRHRGADNRPQRPRDTRPYRPVLHHLFRPGPNGGPQGRYRERSRGPPPLPRRGLPNLGVLPAILRPSPTSRRTNQNWYTPGQEPDRQELDQFISRVLAGRFEASQPPGKRVS